MTRRRKAVTAVLSVAVTAQLAVIGLNLARGAEPVPCDQETSTRGHFVTYGTGADGCVPGTVAYPGVTPPPLHVRPCASDDGQPAPCFWDATTQGNGQGRSFRANADGRIVYLGIGDAR